MLPRAIATMGDKRLDHFFDCTDHSPFTTLNWGAGGIRELTLDSNKIEQVLKYRKVSFQSQAAPSSQCEKLLSFFKYLCKCSAKLTCWIDLLTADIYYYITTEFGYAKRDVHLATYGGVVLQQFEFTKVCKGKNSNQHYS